VFTNIDNNQAPFNIRKYDLRVSSLEEVFIEAGVRERQQAVKSGKQQDDTVMTDVEQTQLIQPTFWRSLAFMTKYQTTLAIKDKSWISTCFCMSIYCVVIAFTCLWSKPPAALNYSDIRTSFPVGQTMLVPTNMATISNKNTTFWQHQMYDPLGAMGGGIANPYEIQVQNRTDSVRDNLE